MIYFISNKTFNTTLDIRGSNSNIFKNQSHHQQDFRPCNFRGCSGVVGVFYFECHTYNNSYNGEQALVLPKLEIKTNHFGMEGVYDIHIHYKPKKNSFK